MTLLAHCSFLNHCSTKQSYSMCISCHIACAYHATTVFEDINRPLAIVFCEKEKINLWKVSLLSASDITKSDRRKGSTYLHMACVARLTGVIRKDSICKCPEYVLMG